MFEKCNFTAVEPNNYYDAAKFKDGVVAMKNEFDSIINNQTRQLVELPKDRKAIGVEWVFRTKFNPDGSVFKNKSRLVVKD